MVIARYITKEIASSFIGLVLIMLFIMLSNKFVVFLAKAAAGKLPVDMLLQVIGLYIPELFGMLAPIALFVAILFTHSRLHADSEIAVLLTSGFDWWRLTKPTLVVAFIVALLVALINLGFAPLITAKRDQLISEGQTVGILYAITPGQIQMVDESSDLVFYVENVLEDNSLHNVFIADKSNNLVITAKSALVKQLAANNEFFLVLKDGYRYVGQPGQADYSVTSFNEYGRELKFTSVKTNNSEYARPTTELIHANDLTGQAELQWRMAMPVAVFILTLLAIPIAKVNPRQGRFAKFLPAALIYMMYYNALTVAKRWIVSGSIGIYPGLWCVHVVFLLFALLLYLQVSGRWHEYYRSLHR